MDLKRRGFLIGVVAGAVSISGCSAADNVAKGAARGANDIGRGERKEIYRAQRSAVVLPGGVYWTGSETTARTVLEFDVSGIPLMDRKIGVYHEDQWYDFKNTLEVSGEYDGGTPVYDGDLNGNTHEVEMPYDGRYYIVVGLPEVSGAYGNPRTEPTEVHLEYWISS